MDLYELTMASWRNMLGTLDGLLAKAQADEGGDALLQERLAEDMHPLAVQVRFLCNMPFEALARLANRPFTSREDDPETLAEARERVAEAKGALDGYSPGDYVDADSPLEMIIPNGMAFDLTAADYVREWVMPNWYFHTSIAYAILRSNGLPLGKADLIPHMMKYLRQSG